MHTLPWTWEVLGFPGGSEVKASACNVGDLGSIPGSGRSPGEGNGNPLQYSCLENPMDGGAWWATVHRVAKSQTQLRNFTSLGSYRTGWYQRCQNKAVNIWNQHQRLEWCRWGVFDVEKPNWGRALGFGEESKFKGPQRRLSLMIRWRPPQHHHTRREVERDKKRWLY